MGERTDEPGAAEGRELSSADRIAAESAASVLRVGSISIVVMLSAALLTPRVAILEHDQRMAYAVALAASLGTAILTLPAIVRRARWLPAVGLALAMLACLWFSVDLTVSALPAGAEVTRLP